MIQVTFQIVGTTFSDQSQDALFDRLAAHVAAKHKEREKQVRFSWQCNSEFLLA